MIDRNNTINYLSYLLNLEKKELNKIDLKSIQKISLSSKINLLENIISSIKQMPIIKIGEDNSNEVDIVEEVVIEDKRVFRKNYKTKEILQYDLRGNFINEYTCLPEAELETGVKASGIINNIKQRQKSAGGFTWKYKYENGDD